MEPPHQEGACSSWFREPLISVTSKGWCLETRSPLAL